MDSSPTKLLEKKQELEVRYAKSLESATTGIKTEDPKVAKRKRLMKKRKRKLAKAQKRRNRR